MPKERINEIDLLRFLAVMAVVLFHYAFRGYAAGGMSIMPYPLAPIAKYGYFGVHLFFLISGFVILMTASTGSFRRFFVSRFSRLYPAFWVCCTITSITTILIGAPRYTVSLRQYLANMTMMSGFINIGSIDGAYWSLFIELRFYAFVAAILAIGQIKKAQFFLAIWLIACIAVDVLQISNLRPFLIVEYAGFFIAGATFFSIWSGGLTRSRVAMLVGSFGLAMYETLLQTPHLERYFNTQIDIFIVAGIITAFFLVMLLISLRRTGSFGDRQWILAGGITYPLYLLHQNIGFMIFNIAYPTIDKHLLLWGTIAIAIGAAATIHIFVEQRFSLQLKHSLDSAIESSHRSIIRLSHQIRHRR